MPSSADRQLSVPSQETSNDCPNDAHNGPHKDAPFPLTDIDRELLAMSDSDFKPITWSQLRHFISTHQLEELKRLPSQLRLYISWCSDIKAQYGSVTNFILQQRVKWEPLPTSTTTVSTSGINSAAPKFAYANATPFADRSDYRVLLNDWPYGFEPGITHIVVWLKTPVPADPETGVITEEGARLIGGFVERYFVQPMRDAGALGMDEDAKAKVVWFKNWIKLQSVRAVEHVHVLVRGATRQLLDDWCDKV
jgi:hypothetical protein